MLDRKQEYIKMARVEQMHWWYRALHYLVLDEVSKIFPDRGVSIIDAGCGTGGLMLFLKKYGYSNIRGFDISPHAADICRQLKLEVEQYDLSNISTLYDPNSADIIVSNDTLYFFDEKSCKNIIKKCCEILITKGLLIMNMPVHNAFRGVHDISVGIKHRFSKSEIHGLISETQLEILREIYWPFFLSPIVYFVRLLQRVKMKMRSSSFDIRSDIDMPNMYLNNLLTRLTINENRYLRTKPFGSSLFVVMQKIDNQDANFSV